jgi:hypothetical protein
MARIMMTGMCSVQDRCAYHADKRRIHYRPFPQPVRSTKDFLEQFRVAANTGNYLITEGAYRSFPEDEVTYVPFWFLQKRVDDPDFIDFIRAEYQTCIFATANILNADFNLTEEVRVLEALDLPTIFLSIGVQRRSDLAKDPHPGVSRFIDYLSRPTSHCFTRGSYAATFLRSRNVANVYEACCPSAFNHADNIIAGMRRLRDLDAGRLGETWVNGYLGDHAGAVDDLTQFAGRSERTAYLLQDEPLLFGITDNLVGEPAAYDETSARLAKRPACDVAAGSNQPIDFLAFFSPDHWRLRASVVDLSIGRRFHGNLVALQAGRPAIFIAHDDRVTEMLEAVGLPFIAPKDWEAAADKPAFAEAFARRVDLARFEDHYTAKREAFTASLRHVRECVLEAELV